MKRGLSLDKKQKLLYNQCKEVMKSNIRKHLLGIGTCYTTKADLLSERGYWRFFSCQIKNSGYKNTTAAINRLAKKPDCMLIKLHDGSGTMAHYAFRHDVLTALIDEVEREMAANEPTQAPHQGD